MTTPDMIPDEVVNALLMYLRLRKGGKEAIAAALNAWPKSYSLAENDSAEIRNVAVIILPLPQEAGDE